MIKGEEWYVIRDMERRGLSISEISRRTGRDRKTVRKVINSSGPPISARRERVYHSKLDGFKGYILSRMNEGVTNGAKIFREIREMGYEGKTSILRGFMHPYRQTGGGMAVERFETPPGKQAQVDWGHFGIIEHRGRRHKLSCFVMTLGYSRTMYCEFTVSRDIHTFERCHINAFRYFGGLPQEILYDRVKTVVLWENADKTLVWNLGFRDFSHFYGFTPRLCRPYRAQTKGKVESAVKYIRGNFFTGMTFEGLEDLNRQAIRWLNQTANTRMHGTTKEIPFHRLNEEGLMPLGSRPDYDTSWISWRRVTRDCFISYRGNLYSVPSSHKLRQVMVKEKPEGTIELYTGGLRVARHQLSYERGKVIAVPEHLPRHQSKQLPPANPFLTETFLRQYPCPEVEARSLEVYEEVLTGSVGR